MVVHEVEPYNAEPPAGVLAAAPLTPPDAFYVRNHGPVPAIDPATWRLRVDGLVDRPLELALDDLRSGFEPRALAATLQCAGNRRAGLGAVRPIPGEHPWRSGATSTAEWAGVALADVLAAAGVGAGAAHVAFAAPDVAPGARPPQPYATSIPLATAIGGDVLLAWSMAGRSLAAVHGAPLRVVVPGHIGARSVKWLERITVQEDPGKGWFQAVAYRDDATATALGPFPVTADILTPADGATVTAGPVEVTGYAFVGDGSGIARVDVSTDGGGSWRPAELEAPAGPWAWRRWRTVVDLAAGAVELVARAEAGSGATQAPDPAALWNPHGYANTSWPRARITVA
jgi:sulfite oxidase